MMSKNRTTVRTSMLLKTTLVTLVLGLSAAQAPALVIDFEDPASQACAVSQGNDWCEVPQHTVGDYVFSRLSGRMNVVLDIAAQTNTTFQENGTTTFSLVGDAWMPYPKISIARSDGASFRLPNFMWAAGNISGSTIQVAITGVSAASRVRRVFDLVVPTPPDPFNPIPTDFWSLLSLPPELGATSFSAYEIEPLGRLIRFHTDDFMLHVPEPAGFGLLGLACAALLLRRPGRHA